MCVELLVLVCVEWNDDEEEVDEAEEVEGERAIKAVVSGVAGSLHSQTLTLRS
jgi:hypothetical protein